MFQRHRRGVFHLPHRAAQQLRQTASRHRAGRAYFALTTHLRPGDRRIVFHQIADVASCRQRAQHRILRAAIGFLHVAKRRGQRAARSDDPGGRRQWQAYPGGRPVLAGSAQVS